jgi:fatty-acyl-CoA synthase
MGDGKPVNDRVAQVTSSISGVTPTLSDITLNAGDFQNLAASLDYAAQGNTGLNFHDARGRLREAVPYSELRERALATARRFRSLGLERGDRVAVLAETTSTFPTVFFACQYAGLVPLALPASLNLGGHEAFVDQLRGLLGVARPRLVVTGEDFAAFVREAVDDPRGPSVYTPDELADMPQGEGALEPTGPDETAYLQFTSGSTSTPRGVVIHQRAVMANLNGILRHGMGIGAEDRCVSWLPFYHDMGMVGMLLGPVASQRSVDYLGTRDFAVRPIQWLRLISQNSATISFAPPFGYNLCARRLRESDLEALDLSSWRVAGVGAELIRPEQLEAFAEALAPAGFDASAFCPSYGLAEASLAVSFAARGSGLECQWADTEAMANDGVVRPPRGAEQGRRLVACGRAMPGHEVVIRDRNGQPLGDGEIGHITIRGPSVMCGYDNDPEASRLALDDEGWLRTGDLGCMTSAGLVITGRSKDLIIVNGRNIWPEDVEQRVEAEAELRSGDVSAFSIDGSDGNEEVVIVLQCRAQEAGSQAALCQQAASVVQAHFGVCPVVDLVGPSGLPRTSSGKLSRSTARREFLERRARREMPTESAAD